MGYEQSLNKKPTVEVVGTEICGYFVFVTTLLQQAELCKRWHVFSYCDQFGAWNYNILRVPFNFYCINCHNKNGCLSEKESFKFMC